MDILIVTRIYETLSSETHIEWEAIKRVYSLQSIQFIMNIIH